MRRMALLGGTLSLLLTTTTVHAQQVQGLKGTTGWTGPPTGNFPDPSSACIAEIAYKNTLDFPYDYILVNISSASSNGNVWKCQSTSRKLGGLDTGYISHVCYYGDNSNDWAVLGTDFASYLCLSPTPTPPPGDQCTANSQPRLPLIGNPVDVVSGLKRQEVVDYESADGNLEVRRAYDYSPVSDPRRGVFGMVWRGLVPATGSVFADANNLQLTLMLPSGYTMVFAYGPGSGAWSVKSPYPGLIRPTLTAQFAVPAQNQWSTYFAQNQVSWTVQFGDSTTFTLTNVVGMTEFSVTPVVVAQTKASSGFTTSYSYGPAGTVVGPRLDSVSGSDGRILRATWNGESISRVDLPDGSHLDYRYDAASPTSTFNDRLRKVERTSATGTVLWSQAYSYEDAAQPYALSGVIDALGIRRTRYLYNKFAQVTSTGKADGSETNLIDYPAPIRDTDSVQRNVTNPLGKVTHYKFQTDPIQVSLSVAGAKFLGQVDDASALSSARSTSFVLSANRVTSAIDYRGTRTQLTYDSKDRPAATTLAVGSTSERTETVTWHPTFDLPLREVRPGQTSDYSYDLLGRLLTRTDTDTTTQTVPYSTAGQTRTWTYAWTPLGKLASINGPKAPDAAGYDDLTLFSYDTSNNLTAVANGLGQVTGYSYYDANGRPGRMIEPSGMVTDFYYDMLGRLISRTVRHPTDSNKNATTSLTYDLEGQLTSMTPPATATIFFDYDPVGRLIAIRDTTGARIDYAYDLLGKRIEDKTTAADATVRRTTARTFDDLGRMLTQTLGQGRTQKLAYDANDNAQLVTNARNQATQFAFDPLDRVVGEVDPLAQSASTSYDGQDNPTRHVDKIAVATTYVRNGFGEVIQESSPDRGVTVYRYDAAGGLISSTDGRGQTVNYTRDVLGRITAKQAVNVAGQDVAYTYDTARIGLVATIVDASGSTTYAYDHRGNVTAKTVGIAGGFNASVGYAYDLADRIVQVTYPSGRSVAYVRDALGQVSGVTSRSAAQAADTVLASSMVYEPFGPLKSLVYGNGLLLAQDWGNDRRLYTKSVKTVSGTARWSKSYLYDGDDNIISLKDNRSTSAVLSFTYDALSRLTRATGYTGSVKREDYSYDANSNRALIEQRRIASDVTPANAAVSTFQMGTNRVTQVNDNSVARKIDYNGRGDVSSELRNASLVTTSYDPYGRLTAYGFFGVPDFTMRYSGTDERVEVTVGTTPRRFIYDEDGRLIGEYGTDVADIKAEHVWLMPEVKEGGYEPLALIGTATTTWVTGDHLGVPVLLTKADGTQSNLFEAAPFGARWKQVAASPTTAIGFPGQIMDVADRFYNMYRDYDPSLGRYLQADPIGLAGGDNVYGYVGGNPLHSIDTDGLTVKIITENSAVYNNLSEAYALLNTTSAGRKITQPLEASKTTYTIRTTHHDAVFCRPGNSKDPRCHGKRNAVFIDAHNSIMLRTTCGYQPTPLSVIIGHELGHADGTDDDGIDGLKMNNVNKNENPIRRELGLPERTQYSVPKLVWIPGTKR